MYVYMYRKGFFHLQELKESGSLPCKREHVESKMLNLKIHVGVDTSVPEVISQCYTE